MKGKVDCNLQSLLESKNHNKWNFLLLSPWIHMEISKISQNTIYTVTCKSTHMLLKNSAFCLFSSKCLNNK